MHPAFAVIEFGPFQNAYHRESVNVDFREALSGYLVSQLLPQADEPFAETAGSLRAAYDHEKHFGPNSAVRDLYSLESEFRRPTGADVIKIALRYTPARREFSPRYRRRPLWLSTARRREARQARANQIKGLADRILQGEIDTARCPGCDAALQVINCPALFDLSCPQGCFNYNFHRDPRSGAFQHGHFFCKPELDA